MEGVSFRTRAVADRTVLEVAGEIDVYTAPELKQRLLDLIAGGARHVVVDLESVEFIDSTGVGVFTGRMKDMWELGGHLSLVCTRERVLKVFRLMGLTTPAGRSGGSGPPILDIHPSVEVALQAPVPEVPEGIWNRSGPARPGSEGVRRAGTRPTPTNSAPPDDGTALDTDGGSTSGTPPSTPGS